MNSFGDRVKAERLALGLSQKQLGSMSGLSQTTISDIERGRNVSSSEIIPLARALKVPADWLADGRDPKYPHRPDDRDAALLADQRQLLDEFQQLTPHHQLAVRAVIRTLLEGQDGHPAEDADVK